MTLAGAHQHAGRRRSAHGRDTAEPHRNGGSSGSATAALSARLPSRRAAATRLRPRTRSAESRERSRRGSMRRVVEWSDGPRLRRASRLDTARRPAANYRINQRCGDSEPEHRFCARRRTADDRCPSRARVRRPMRRWPHSAPHVDSRRRPARARSGPALPAPDHSVFAEVVARVVDLRAHCRWRAPGRPFVRRRNRAARRADHAATDSQRHRLRTGAVRRAARLLRTRPAGRRDLGDRASRSPARARGHARNSGTDLHRLLVRRGHVGHAARSAADGPRGAERCRRP